MAALFKKFVPSLLVSSPQPRAYCYADMVAKTNGWDDVINVESAFDDVGSDPVAKSLIPDLKRLAKRYRCEVEEGLLRCKKTRVYLWIRSFAMFYAMVRQALDLQDGAILFMASHGGQIEMRCLRMRLIQRGIPLENQRLGQVNVRDLPAGMLATCEAYIYHDVEIADGKIISVGKIEKISIPTE